MIRKHINKKKSEILKQKDMFMERYATVSNIGNNLASTDISGHAIVKSENIENGLIVYQVKNGRNLFMAGGSDGDVDLYDLMLGGAIQASNMYGVFLCGMYTENIMCSCHIIGHCTNIYYSHSLEHCSYCFGCRGLKNKSFCILNKQYTKEDRFEKTNEIFAQMDTDGILGDYFSGSICPFYFNDTTAYLLDDTFTKEEVVSKGYFWRDEPIKIDIPKFAETITISELNKYQGRREIPPTPLAKGGSEPANGGIDKQRWIDPEILKKVIVDEKGNSYRIIKMEYDFLMKYGLPLPELHWLDRIKLGFRFK